MSKKNKNTAPEMQVDKKYLAELEEKKKELQRAKKRHTKKYLREKKREEEELRKRQEHKLIQSTQLSVPIRDVLRGVVITKDGRYLKILEFAPQNFLMLSNAERNRIIASFQSMLKVIPAKVQFKIFSRKAKTESLLATMRRSHETEENELCRKMQEEYMDLIKDTALREGVTRRFFIIVEYTDDVATNGTDFLGIVGSLNMTAARIKNYMEQAGNRYIPSCEDDNGIASLLYEILNRRASESELFSERASKVYKHYTEAAEAEGSSETPVIPATEFVAPAWIDYKHPRHIAIDDKFYTFGYFAGEGYPNYVVGGWLSSFVNASEGIDLDIFLEKIPNYKIENTIGRQIRNNRAKLKETSDTSTEATSVANLVQSGFYLLEGLANGEEFYYANILVTVTADSLPELNRRYDELEKMAKSMGLKMRRPMFQMEEAFESSLPLCKIKGGIKRKSRHNMLSSGASSLYPFISRELQDPNGIMMGVATENNSLVAVDVFDTSRHANANGAILGKSGYGKTFTAQLLAIRMRLQNIQTFIITPIKGKEDYKRACDQIDGQYIALGPGSPYYINVLDIRVPDTEGLQDLDGYGEGDSLLAKKVQDLHTFFHLVVRDLTQEEEQMLDGFVYNVYKDFGITDDNTSVFVPGTKIYKRFPLLGDIHKAIENEPVLRRVYNILTPLVNGSLSVYNKHTNVNLDNKYIVFDMNGTKGQNLALSMFVTLDFVWSKIKENRLAKKAVFIDEAWQLIGTAGNEMSAEYVKEIFKTIRAFGGSAFVMTQEVNDFFALKNGEYGKAIISNSDTKICLHMDRVDIERMVDIMTLTPEELKKVTNLQRGSGLVFTGNTKLFVDFKASAFEKDVITTDPEYLRRKLKANKDIQHEKEAVAPVSSESTDTVLSHENASDDPVLEIDDFDDVKTVRNYDEFDFLDDRRALSELPTSTLNKPEEHGDEAKTEQGNKSSLETENIDSFDF